MGTAFVTLIVGALGVAGTLLSPVLAQRTAARAMRDQAAAEREKRAEERAAARDEERFLEKREKYTELNALARNCRNKIKELMIQHVDTGRLSDDDVAALHDAWLAYEDAYHQGHMFFPDDVVAIASQINRVLARGYRSAKAVAYGSGAPMSPQELYEYFDVQALEFINQLRRTMREDLGVASRTASATAPIPAVAELLSAPPTFREQA